MPCRARPFSTHCERPCRPVGTSHKLEERNILLAEVGGIAAQGLLNRSSQEMTLFLNLLCLACGHSFLLSCFTRAGVVELEIDEAVSDLAQRDDRFNQLSRDGANSNGNQLLLWASSRRGLSIDGCEPRSTNQRCHLDFFVPQRHIVTTLAALPPGAGKRFTVADRNLALFNVNGQIYAIDDRCPHDSASLAEGSLDGTTIICPWHGAEFDVTSGKVLCPPAVENVASYPVFVKGDAIEVAI